MKKYLLKTKLKSNLENPSIDILLNGNRRMEKMKQQLFDLLETKKQEFKEFASKYNIENIGVELELTYNGFYCNFIAINKFSDFDLTDDIKLEFSDLLGSNFIILEEKFKDRIQGTFESYRFNEEIAKQYYSDYFEAFQELEDFYKKRSIKYNDYLDNIELFINPK